MRIEITEESAGSLAEYARIPIAFEVRRILDVTAPANELGGLLLTERSIETPYLKNYDAVEGGAPTHWGERFDLSHWGLFVARADGQRVGGAAVAFDSPDVTMLNGRVDVALLWDIRVAPEMRGRGVGAALLRAAEAWAVARGCVRLDVETQNINAPACQFYARNGMRLGTIRKHAYAGLPHEVQLIWYKELTNSVG
jgi:GNAT superfamily N-acetyltransferase